jgi:hypothetical protein
MKDPAPPTTPERLEDGRLIVSLLKEDKIAQAVQVAMKGGEK